MTEFLGRQTTALSYVHGAPTHTPEDIIVVSFGMRSRRPVNVSATSTTDFSPRSNASTEPAAPPRFLSPSLFPLVVSLDRLCRTATSKHPHTHPQIHTQHRPSHKRRTKLIHLIHSQTNGQNHRRTDSETDRRWRLTLWDFGVCEVRVSLYLHSEFFIYKGVLWCQIQLLYETILSYFELTHNVQSYVLDLT